MSTVPGAVTLLVSPVRHQPELVRRVCGREDIHADESQRLLDQVRPVREGLPHVLLQPIGNNKTTHGHEHLSLSRFLSGMMRLSYHHTVKPRGEALTREQ